MRQSSGLIVAAALRLRASGSIPKSDVWKAMRATRRPISRRCASVDLAVVEGRSPDPQVGQVLDRVHIPLGVEAVIGGDRLARERLIRREGVGLVARPLDGERPALAMDAHPRQRLLQDEPRARRVVCAR